MPNVAIQRQAEVKQMNREGPSAPGVLSRVRRDNYKAEGRPAFWVGGPAGPQPSRQPHRCGANQIISYRV